MAEEGKFASWLRVGVTTALSTVGIITVEDVEDNETGVPPPVPSDNRLQGPSQPNDSASFKQVLGLLRGNVFVEESPYAKFCAQRDTLREFISDEAQLVRAALKASGLSLQDVLADIERCKTRLAEEGREFGGTITKEQVQATASFEETKKRLEAEAVQVASQLKELQARQQEIERQKGEAEEGIQKNQRLFQQRQDEFNGASKSLEDLLAHDLQLLSQK